MAGSTTTVYLGGLWEETSAGATKACYSFGGQTMAVRDSATGVAYLHGDHLGSLADGESVGTTVPPLPSFLVQSPTAPFTLLGMFQNRCFGLYSSPERLAAKLPDAYG